MINIRSNPSENDCSNDLTVELNYIKDTGRRPWLYARPLMSKDAHSTNFGGTNDPREVRLRDGRGNEDLTLDASAFQFVNQTTSISKEEFYKIGQEHGIKEAYYEEVKDLVKRTTGAEEVVVFNHELRNGGGGGGGGGYAKFPHVDYAASRCEHRFKEFVGKLDDDKYRKGRFVIINVWRNISDAPIRQDPLAVCDARTVVMPDDFVAQDYFGQGDLRFEQYRLASRNRNKHGWYYLPEMTRDEVVLFKQYDSDTTKAGRMCFHTAVSLPDAPEDAPPRESVEVRVIALFPDHSPNSCPDFDDIVDICALEDNPPQSIADNVNFLLKNAGHLPLLAQAIYRWVVRSSNGAERFLDLLLRDRRGRLGLKGAEAATRQAVKDIIMDSETFCDDMLSAKKKLDLINKDRRQASPWTWWWNPLHWF